MDSPHCHTPTSTAHKSRPSSPLCPTSYFSKPQSPFFITITVHPSHHSTPCFLIRTLCMDRNGSGPRPSYNRNAGDRRFEIVSGKKYVSTNSNAPYYASGVSSHATRMSKPWSFNDAETKWKKRVAAYKAYGVGGKVKATVRTGFRWIKNKCWKIFHAH